MLSAIKYFANLHGYSVCFLWGVTSGVSYCRYEELLSPQPGVRVINISAQQLASLESSVKANREIMLDRSVIPIFCPKKPGHLPPGHFLSWNLEGCWALAGLAGGHPPHLVAEPSAAIRSQANYLARKYDVSNRIGIRVRVEEYRDRDRKPHRNKRELDEALKPILQLPWHTKVFVATDSEYVQMMLASHFRDIRYLPKKFDLQESSGRYIHRQDKDAMFTFLKEVVCLCRCRKIINIGGFLNERSVKSKIIEAPYTTAIQTRKRVFGQL